MTGHNVIKVFFVHGKDRVAVTCQRTGFSVKEKASGQNRTAAEGESAASGRARRWNVPEHLLFYVNDARIVGARSAEQSAGIGAGLLKYRKRC